MGFGELPRHAPSGPPCRASPNDQVVGTGSRPSSGRQLMHLAETTILVVTARVPVWWGQNADLRLRSIFPFLFLKRPSTSHTRGLNLPPMSRRRWESTYMYLAGCSSPLEAQWYLVRPTVPLRPPSPKPLPIGTTCVRKYHWERFLAQRLLFSRRGGPSAGQGKSSRRPTCLFPLGGQRMAAVWTVRVVRGGGGCF